MVNEEADVRRVLRLLNEIAVIDQFARTRLQRVLPHDLSLSQFAVLNHFARLGGAWTPVSLASAFQVTKGAISNTLRKLETKGFIAVSPDPNDGRAKHVTLTAAGRAARADAVAAAGPPFADLADVLDQTDFEAALPLLVALRRRLDPLR